jgi:hypothetical protein
MVVRLAAHAHPRAAGLLDDSDALHRRRMDGTLLSDFA